MHSRQTQEQTVNSAPTAVVPLGRGGHIKPLRPHRNGQWYVPLRINGKRVNRYFGRIADDPQKQRATSDYLAYLNQLMASGGQPMDGRSAADVTVLELVDRFITFHEQRYHAGDIGFRQFRGLRAGATLLLEWAGPNVIADHLANLMELRVFLSRRYSAESFNSRAGIIKQALKWGRKHNPPLLTRPLDEDPALARKPAKLVKRERRERDEAHGVPEYAPAEALALLIRAEQLGKHDLVSAILLGMNAGMHAQHISDLPRSERVVQLDHAAGGGAGAGRIDWVRTKSEEIFQVALWPITVAALRRSMRQRPRPAAPEFADRLMLRENGRPWVEEIGAVGRDGRIGKIRVDDEFADRLDVMERRLASLETARLPEPQRQSMKRRGRLFYGFRRTFDSLADQARDHNARLRIMGQSFKGHDPNYIRGDLSWERIAAVTDHVHRAFFGCGPNELLGELLEGDEIVLEHLIRRFGEPVLLAVNKGGNKGQAKPYVSELNRRRWQDPAWRAQYAQKRAARAEARAAARAAARQVAGQTASNGAGEPQ